MKVTASTLNETPIFFYMLSNKGRMIEEQVLRKVVPSENEDREIKETVSFLIEMIVKTIKKLKIKGVEPMVVGSIAKGTYLKNPDIDIFLLFPKETERDELERLGLEIGRAVLRGEERYAEHPYIHGIYRGLDVDIVPCFKIESPSQKMSAVDRTPFHTRYVLDNLKKEQIREVRLLKQFLKGIGVYGAEAEVQGFSGYLCELLIMKFSTFENLIRNAQNWRLGEKLSLTKEDGKFEDPLVFIDPVDPNRNVASALSQENFLLFIHACNEYLKKPNIRFFFPRKLRTLTKASLRKMMEERDTKFIALVFRTPDVIEDILYPQLRKCQRNLVALCEEHDFKVYDSRFSVGKEVILLFEFEIFRLPSVKKHVGPPIYHKNAKEFIEKWKNSRSALSRPYIEGKRWVVDVKREYTDARELIWRELLNLNLGKHINESVRESFKIIEDGELVRKAYQTLLTEFLVRRFRWEY